MNTYIKYRTEQLWTELLWIDVSLTHSELMFYYTLKGCVIKLHVYEKKKKKNYGWQPNFCEQQLKIQSILNSYHMALEDSEYSLQLKRLRSVMVLKEVSFLIYLIKTTV